MITVEHLTKCYGDFVAVDNLSFTIPEGHVYGFLGPNVAGKSTTMNIITGCLSATEGTVNIDGYDILEQPNQAKRLIGYLPEQPPLYLNETPLEYLHFVGRAKGLKGEELKQQIWEVLEQTGLEHRKHCRIGALSKGYKQRVGIAQALLGNPRVIILDEPTVGLDPLQIIEIRDLIRELGKKHTVIFSSHILSEVQAICDRVLIISKGKLIAFDEPSKLEQQLLSPNEIQLVCETEQETVSQILSGVANVTHVQFSQGEHNRTIAQLQSDATDVYTVSKEIFLSFAKAQLPLLELSVRKANLEDIFLELTEEKETQTQEEREEENHDCSAGA